MKIIYKIAFCLFLSLFSLSCKKWIDVKPTDRLTEEQLFVDRSGYMKALNGVYIGMVDKALYGQDMTAGTVDVMAQYYFINQTQHVYLPYATFTYTAPQVRKTYDDMWRKAYELVANCNVIIEKCGDAPSQILQEPYYGIIKGEALALRAYFHLDMLRLFGPIYSEENKTLAAIPYVNKTGFEVAPILNSEQVMLNVIADLKAALALMEATDPVRTEGVKNNANSLGTNELHYRQYRLNYYAIKALLARAYLWQGDRANALIESEALLAEVQAVGKNVFPYVTAVAAIGNLSANPPVPADRIFSTEVMFGLYDMNRVKTFDDLFNVSLENTRKLSFSAGDGNEARVNELYDDANDYRRRIWQNASSGSVTAITNMKYVDAPNTPGRYMVPLIRLSEVLLIAAESHPDLATGVTYLNKVRNSRNALSQFPATETALKNAITAEFRKEMIGEGQQFFFYKRRALTAVPNHASITGTKTMVLNNYMVPLPESEISQRN